MAQQPRVRAPELIGARGWLNTDKPLSLRALRGKVVLLDFWTYGCINCIHIIPHLKKLEAKYANQLVVIGIHSAKFDNEGETENIRKIILRYELEHPVANDVDYNIWNLYAVRAYPTQVLIDPNGYVTHTYVGEGNHKEIDQDIQETVTEFRQKGRLDEKPLEFALEKGKVGNLPLAFPGKVLADSKSNRLFISDSNHNRIVITDLQGKVIETIGTGESGLKDGNFQTANFNRPQGLALDGENLYVADTENHAIRIINLRTNEVKTIAGDGTQAEWRTKGGDVKNAKLSSPWDVSKIGDSLFIAMAGTHQIWKLDFAKQTVSPFAGSGAEARLDGNLPESAFAQPSGLASDGEKLWVADSESNVIREIDLENGTVTTLVGGDLYDFGDVDGKGDDVRFQHPLGLAINAGKLLIADTYNHKIKELDPGKRNVKSLFGSRKSGQTDGVKSQFYEPGGLSVADGKLYVADTNNNAIRVVDLANRDVSTLRIAGLSSPKATEPTAVLPNLKVIKSDRRTVGVNSTNIISFDVRLPKGFHLNQEAPNRFEISADGGNIKLAKTNGKFTTLPLTISFESVRSGEAVIIAKLTVFFCREDNTGECLIRTLAWNVPLAISSHAANEIFLVGDTN